MSFTRGMKFACEGDWRALSAVWGGEGTPAHKSFEQKACLGSAWTEAHLRGHSVTDRGGSCYITCLVLPGARHGQMAVPDTRAKLGVRS